MPADFLTPLRINWLKRNLVSGAVLLLLVTLLATEAWLWSGGRAQARRALVALEKKKQERETLARISPSLAEANDRALDRDLTDAGSALAAQRAEWPDRDGPGAAAAAPAKSIDAYFEIAAFVEQTRALAARAQVKTRADEGFGFTSHLHQGPATELAPAVCRQLRVLRYLTEILLDAHPLAVLAVQREHPLTATQRSQRRQPGRNLPPVAAAVSGGDHPEDFFEWNERLSLRAPGRIDGEAFRLEFSGQTPVLRNFMNRLAAGGWPIFVRSVDVGPLESRDAARPAVPLAAPGALQPLVAANPSRFAVVVECVDFVADTENPAP